MLGSVVPVSPAAYGDASALHARFPAGGTTFPREPKDAGSNPNRPSVTQRSRAADARRVRRGPTPAPASAPGAAPAPDDAASPEDPSLFFSRRFVLGSRAASTSASAPHASHPTLPGAHGEAGADASTRFGASKSVRSPFEVLRRRSARGGVLGRLPSKAVISPAAGAAAGLRRRDGRVSKGVSRGGPPRVPGLGIPRRPRGSRGRWRRSLCPRREAPGPSRASSASAAGARAAKRDPFGARRARVEAPSDAPRRLRGATRCVRPDPARAREGSAGSPGAAGSSTRFGVGERGARESTDGIAGGRARGARRDDYRSPPPPLG